MINHLEHSIRVANLSFKLALLLGMPSEEANSIYKSGLFHDLGKIKINPKILNKPARLTDEEFEYIKKHSLYSYKIALGFGFSDAEALNILFHHENFDGTGYPIGIKGEEIPLGARIIRICDMFDALTSDRPYKSKLDLSSAIEIMTNEEKNFDKKIFNVFLEDIKYKGAEVI